MTAAYDHLAEAWSYERYQKSPSAGAFAGLPQDEEE